MKTKKKSRRDPKRVEKDKVIPNLQVSSELYTVAQVAKAAGISVQTLHYHMKKRNIGTRIGHNWVLNKKERDYLVNKRTSRTGGTTGLSRDGTRPYERFE